VRKKNTSIVTPILADDEAGTAFECDVGPCPLENDYQAVLENSQIVNVDRQPGKPSETAIERDGANFDNSLAATNLCHLALIHESERLSRQALFIRQNCPCDISALLHRNRGGSRQRTASLMHKDRLIACNEHVGMSRNAHIRVDEHPALTIHFQTGKLTEGG